MPGENLSYDMTEAEAEALLRRDLMKRYALFRSYGKDALLLTVLSYNVGHPHCLDTGNAPKAACSESWRPETVTYTGNTFPIATTGDGRSNQ